ncbi:Uncharacterised protein [Acinetobacter baumannii]|nr:Uncharacterised protein [Acinetobacter baumannii]
MIQGHVRFQGETFLRHLDFGKANIGAPYHSVSAHQYVHRVQPLVMQQKLQIQTP